METALEWILTNSYKADMISWLSAHPEYFEEAIELALTNKPPFSWRAAWLLWSCMEENDKRMQGHVKDIIEALSEKKDNHQRELMIILQKMEIREELEGLLFNHCAEVWEKINKQPSVRLNAFKMMVRIAQKHPDLFHEIAFLTQEQYLDSLSPAVRRSVSRMKKELG
jgi:hypothetical protein